MTTKITIYENTSDITLNDGVVELEIAEFQVSQDGVDGVDGTNGTNGIDGVDGVDGIDGTVTALTTAENDFVVGDALNAWVTKTLAQTLDLLAAGFASITEKSTPVDGDDLLLSDSAASDVAKRVSWANIKATLLTYFYTIFPAKDGWMPGTGTWAYASATTITVPSGAAAIYSVGDKIKLTQTTVKYFYVVAVADTVLTVTGGSDYTVANAAITSPYYSKGASPVGFPSGFNYTPTGTNIGGTGLAYAGYFSINGKLAYLYINVTGTNTTSTLGVSTLTMPAGLAAAIASICTSTNSFVANIGCGLVATSTVFPPTWGAAASVYVTSTFVIS